MTIRLAFLPYAVRGIHSWHRYQVILPRLNLSSGVPITVHSQFEHFTLFRLSEAVRTNLYYSRMWLTIRDGCACAEIRSDNIGCILKDTKHLKTYPTLPRALHSLPSSSQVVSSNEASVWVASPALRHVSNSKFAKT